MRFMVTVRWDIEKGNELAKTGKLGPIVQSILQETRPEHVFFRADQGCRSAVLIYDLNSAAEMPRIAEPWFLAANATVQFEPVMLPEDLAKAGPDIESAVKKYGRW